MDRVFLALLPLVVLTMVVATILFRPANARSVSDVLDAIGGVAEQRLRQDFERANVTYPPESISLLAIKDERIMELWARGQGTETATLIRRLPILAASGVAGPKLREGDFQVPEGVYRIVVLNPNSSYHLSMKLNYPNEFDRQHARADGRDYPGSNIFIHGRAVSAGCLAMGDAVIEELFSLVARIGREQVEVLIAPSDPRLAPLDGNAPQLPEWTSELYATLNERFAAFTSKQPLR